jgi:hypothetical protein
MTGLDPTYPWWHALAHEYKPRDRSQRFLTPAQAGMLIQLLEGVRALEDRSNDAVFGALQLVWLIVQRSAALVGMESLKSDPCLSGLLPIVATSIFAVRWVVKMSLHST